MSTIVEILRTRSKTEPDFPFAYVTDAEIHNMFSDKITLEDMVSTAIGIGTAVLDDNPETVNRVFNIATDVFKNGFHSLGFLIGMTAFVANKGIVKYIKPEYNDGFRTWNSTVVEHVTNEDPSWDKLNPITKDIRAILECGHSLHI